MTVQPKSFVLLLFEVQYHPNSYLTSLTEKFERTSIIRVSRKEELRRFNKPPLFDSHYLVLFDNVKIFSDNRVHINYDYMLPVLHVETKAQLEDAKFLCRGTGTDYRIYYNEFTKEQAVALIQSQTTERLSKTFCDSVIRQVGLNPLRIITAMGVCAQVGYTKQSLEKYVDKWVSMDIRRLIECLLGVPKSKSAIRTSLLYLQVNRYWYKNVANNIIGELDYLLEVYRDKLSGELSSQNVFDYIDEKRISRARVMYALSLFERVSIASIMALREYIKNASLMEVVLRLG